MSTIIIALHLSLLLAVVPLVVMSKRTSRAHRGRHQGFVAMAGVIGLMSLLLAVASLALVLDGSETVDTVMVLVPPVLTIAACGWVLRRGMWAQEWRGSRR